MFADYTCIFTKSSSTYESANIKNEDLSNIEIWASQWLVKFSPAKTESMFISLQTHNACNLLCLVFYNTPMANVPHYKHAGLWISNKLKWDTHVTSCINKCLPLLGILRSLKLTVSRAVLAKTFSDLF